MQAYRNLEETFTKLNRIGGILSVLHWDTAVVMPVGAAEERAEQQAYLQGLYHEIITSPKIPQNIEKAKSESKNLNEWQQQNLKLIENSYIHSSAVSEKLVTDLAKAGAECEMIWRTARAENDFKSFSKYLKKVLALVREIAAVKAEKLKLSKYDALLDQFDSGRRSKDIDIIFADLKKFIPGFLPQVLEAQKKHKFVVPEGPFPASLQKLLGERIMDKIGFDFQHGRLDTSHHPFCGGSSGDIRITTRYNENDFTSSLMGVLHETGHALYENNLPKEWHTQPVGQAGGMALHESQSLFMEMQICRSAEFMEYAAPLIRDEFGREGPAYTAQNLYNFYSQVKPSLIRVDADEVTYPAHVILRYEIEKDLVEGNMEIEDLPEAWNKSMKDLLGLNVPSDKDGCMQDIHWTDGSFGYFPTYTLGAMTAAQLAAALKKAYPDVMNNVKSGDFQPITDWLKENVHRYGSLYEPDELLKKSTGSPLNVEFFKNHLKNRYLD